MLALDIDPATTNDQTVDLINFHIQRVVQKLTWKLRPKEIFKQAGPITVTSSTTSIAIGVGGFAVTDLSAIFGVSVDVDFASTGVRDDKMWSPIDWTLWVGSDYDLTDRAWTYDPDGNIYLNPYPAGTSTYRAYLWYYKQIDAITDIGVPPIPAEHQLDTIVPGTILCFPHRFVGGRAELLQMYVAMYSEGVRDMMAGRRLRTQRSRFRPGSSNSTNFKNTFPDWQDS